MSDTKQRIAEYKQILPGLKERIVAVALLLVISLTMVTTTTFAWLVLSRSPEMSGVTTTIAANGNLEIALAKPDGSMPDESKVDSFAAMGKDLVSANVTWGNLVNLADKAYGLENLVLRPAMLVQSSLLTNPLRGAKYDSDGRIDGYIRNFGYTQWVPPEGVVEGYFGVSDKYGVRAISSVTTEVVGAAGTWRKILDTIDDSHNAAQDGYQNMVENSDYQNVLAVVIGAHMTATLNGSDDGDDYWNPAISIETMESLLQMYDEIMIAYLQEAQAIADMLNAQVYLETGVDKQTFTADEIFTITQAQVTERSPKINLTNSVKGLEAFQTYYKKISDGRDQIATIIENNKGQGQIRWRTSNMISVITGLVNIDECMLTYNKKAYTVKAFIKDVKDNPTSYLGLVMGGGSVDVEITNGVLYQLEMQLGKYLNIQKLAVSAKMNIQSMNMQPEVSIKTNVVTSAKTTNESVYFDVDRANLEDMFTGEVGGEGTPVADQTYALVVDFWVRTNAENSYLTLAGNVLTKTEEITATMRDFEGNEVEVYTLSVEEEDENGEKNTSIYELYRSGGTWYNAITHNAFEFPEGYSDADVILKKIEVTIVEGYEGENRVWGDDAMISADASTQGSGSCYVFYYASPEDKAKTLELLSSMRIAFVDAQGNLLTEAFMDTKRAYDDNGRVIVPMALETTVTIVGENGDIPVITYLERNQAMRITAIVYLDGRTVDNSQVLVSSSVQGQVNLQFTNTNKLKPAEDGDLFDNIIQVSAVASKTQFTYDGSPAISRITASVMGTDPSKVEAFFVRSINSMQGTRDHTVSFEQQDGAWVADYSFTTPGTYLLRSLLVDGIEYSLASPIKVIVEGFAVDAIGWGEASNNVAVFTSDRTHSTSVSVKFAADTKEAMPSSVRVVFSNTDNDSFASSTLTYDYVDHRWKGDVTFSSSGNYELMYLVMDGEYTPVDTSQKKYANISLGITVSVYTDETTTEFKYSPAEMAENGTDILNMRVKVFNDRGSEIKGLDNAKLTYRMRGSQLTNSMEALLSYNGEFYVCEYNAVEAGAGIWEFVSVVIGNCLVTNANIAPTFYALSPNPPTYVSSTDELGSKKDYAFVYVTNNSASISADIGYTSAANVYAVFKNETGEEKEVPGSAGQTNVDTQVTTWNFKIPNNSVTNTQDGIWELVSFKIDNVYDEAGNRYSYDPNNPAANKPYVINVAAKKIGLRVLNRINVTYVALDANENRLVQKDYSAAFGLDSNKKPSAAFMTSHNITSNAAPIYVKITDYLGNDLIIDGKNLVGNVKLTITYKAGSSTAKGGYSNTDLANDMDVADLEFTYDTTLKVWKANAATLTYAGVYNTSLSYTINNTPNSESAGAPTFEVWSIAPTVRITARSDYGSSSNTDTSATVQFGSSKGTCGTNYQQPYVSITLSGKGQATSAYLQFAASSGGTVHLYASGGGSTSTNKYEWTADGVCQRYVGYYKSKTASTDDMTVAGTLTATTLKLIHGGVEYSFDINDITINNPS